MFIFPIIIPIFIGIMFLIAFISITITVVRRIKSGSQDLVEFIDDSLGGDTKPKKTNSYKTCDYCGSSVNSNLTKCPNCSASLKNKKEN